MFGPVVFIVATWPFAFFLLIIWGLLRLLFPRNKPLIVGSAVASLTFWIAPCVFIYLSIREIVYTAKSTNTLLYHTLKGLGFSESSNGDLIHFWNLYVLGFWLGLFSGVVTYLYMRLRLRHKHTD
jgi:hypothetical protein